MLVLRRRAGWRDSRRESRVLQAGAQHADLEQRGEPLALVAQSERKIGMGQQRRPIAQIAAQNRRISRASTPAREAASGAPPESSMSTFQRSNSARTRSASPRSGVTSAAVRPGVSKDSRKADRDGQRLLALVQRFDQTHIGQRRR